MTQINISNISFTIVVFATLSLPSLKLIYSSPILNAGLIVAYLFFLLHFYIKSPIILHPNQRIFLTLFLALFVLVFLAYFIFPFSYFSLDKFVKYLFIFLAGITVATFVNKVNIQLLINLMIAWGLFLCVWKLALGISLNFDKGQTYLTYGMPIGCSLLLLMLKVFDRLTWQQIIILAALIGLNGIAILTSRGRSSIIYPFLSFSVVLLASFFTPKNRKVAVKVFILLSIISIIAGFYILANLEMFKSLARIIALVESGGEDNRLGLWLPAINAIKNNPFGYGTDSYEYLLKHYPHNIFLEVTLAYGVFGLMLFSAFLFVPFQQFRENIQKDLSSLSISTIGLYFFLSWNTSHDFATATIPFVAFALSLRS